MRGLKDVTGLSAGTAQKEVNRLVRLGLLTDRKSGKQRYLRANPDHPAFQAVAELIRVTAGISSEIAHALRENPRIERVLLFGSVASGSEGPESDVDLLVVGDVQLGELLALLDGVSERIKRPINPVLMDSAEFEERRLRREHFLTRVLESNPITLVGATRDDAAELVGKQRPQDAPDQQRGNLESAGTRRKKPG